MKRSFDVLVVGGGVGGAGAAIFSAKNHPMLSFCIAEFREDCLRGNHLHSIQDVDVFKEAGVDKIKDKSSTVQIKEVERQMRGHLQTLENITTFIPYRVIKIDKKNRVATLRYEGTDAKKHPVIEIVFQHIVLADGAQRRSFELLGLDKTTTHEACITQWPESHYAVVRLQCKTHSLVKWELTGAPSRYFSDHVAKKAELDALLQSLKTITNPNDSSQQLDAWDKPWLPDARALLVRKKGQKYSYQFGLTLGVAGAVGSLVMACISGNLTHVVPLLMIMAFGLSFSQSISIQQTIGGSGAPMGVTVSLFCTVMNTIALLCTLLISYLPNKDLLTIVSVICCLCVLAGIFSWLARRQQKAVTAS